MVGRPQVITATGGAPHIDLHGDFIPKQNTDGWPKCHCLSTMALLTHMSYIPSTNQAKWKDEANTWMSYVVDCSVRAAEVFDYQLKLNWRV